ncbi:probable serine/threonine-protein kinase DDB_G0282963 isoform X2 [Leptopilina heterotoma]|uniref:probable serine/threonine-protein kinase DDB_G0282963 isoform X2 n=1 Tax=Leptopilina heterotoma TaxID=63436 RepID=UPI001CA96F8A|nr:probable serine/threonine-protein kinase DDB_G0282963 isoform X2 [Leptopilina heterotoma]
MDNIVSSNCMTEKEEAVKLHENIEQTTNSLNFLQDKSEQDENGHIALSSAGGDDNGALECIDIMLPTLESSIQHEEKNGDNMVAAYESSKQNIYQYTDENHQNDEVIQEDEEEGGGEEEEANDQIQDLELQENQVINVHQDQVIIQTMETLHFDESNLANEYIDDENLNSHIVEQEEKENEKKNNKNEVLDETILEDNYDIEENLQNNDENSEECQLSLSVDQFEDETIHKETIADYCDESLIDNNKGAEFLENSNSECELNDEYTHLTNPPEIQLSNATQDLTDDAHHHSLDSNKDLISPNQTSDYEVYSSNTEENTIQIHNDENDKLNLNAVDCRKKNLINIAAVSANIDIQDGEPDKIPEENQEEKQINDNENEKTSVIQESINIENSERDLCNDELVCNHDGQIIMIEKEGGDEDEGTSEVIEEIYFIQDVDGCNDNNYEEKNINNINEKIQQNDNQNENIDNEEEDDDDDEEEQIEEEEEEGEEDDEEEEAEEEEESTNYFSKTSRKSVVKNSNNIVEKSRNVIQDIFDDWGDENADEDNQIFSTKIQDTVEIELNNLLNDDNIKKKPLTTNKEIIQNENSNIENDNNDYDSSTVISMNKKNVNVKNPQEETRNPSNSVTTSSTSSIPSSSSSSISVPAKKITRDLTRAKDDIPSFVQPYVRGTYSSELSASSLHHDQDGEYEELNSRKKLQSPRLGVKVPSRHLKSQIATPAEVTEVLKERLREKQKNLESPQGADIVFVKKLTQRFASKICAGGTMPVPALIPIQQSRDSLERVDSSSVINNTTINSNDNSDNRELLAILEGDVDPDWSKPQSLTRELALKQLDETLSKGNKRLKKKNLKVHSNKQAAEKDVVEKSPLTVQEEKLKPKDGNLNKKKVDTIKQKRSTSAAKLSTSPSSLTKPKRTSLSPAQKSLKENDSQNTQLKPTTATPTPTTTTLNVEIRPTDETRSGRKRKPTEKALEQYASKRQRMFKTNSSPKVDSDIKADKQINQILNATVSTPTKRKKSNSEQVSISDAAIITNVEGGSKEDSQATDNNLISSKSPSSNIRKMDKNAKTPDLGKKEKDNFSSPTTSLEETRTRKSTTATILTKRFLSPRLLKHQTKKATNVQKKISPTTATMSSLHKRPVGRPAKINVPKRLLVKERSAFKKTETLKPKRKRRSGIKEIDKLLQDEGVVNLLYDVGQPRKKRLIPITKSQKKVMDIEKAERDLDLRKKLVKSTVLGLRDSDIKLNKIAYRTKRRTSPPKDTLNNNNNNHHHHHHHPEDICSSSSSSASSSSAANDKRKNSTEMNTEFIYPAKIRNAADASIIVRRHSSSSFSSVSGSPRVSIDSPLETGQQQSNDENNHGLRSTTKRKQSSSDKASTKHNILEAKRNKQQSSTNTPLPPSNKSPKSCKINITQPSSSTLKSEDKDKDTRIDSIKKQSKTVDINEGNKKLIKNSNLNQDAADENTNNLETTDKITTRSSGSNSAALKKTPNSQNKKRIVKEKSTSLTSNNNNDKVSDTRQEESCKNQDKLSACLAEAATALLSVTSNTNTNCDTESSEIEHGKHSSTANSMGRKNKALTNDVKKQSDKYNSCNSSSDPTHSDTSLNSRLFSDNKEIGVSRNGNLVQLILTPSTTKLTNGITLKVMQELCNTLSILKTDEECRVVLFTSNGGTSFCEGLDLSTLIHANKEKRKIYAQEMANAVKEFIKCLATFNKPLVAGVQGAAVGLGVTILPLFDLVIASDKATFYTPYGKLGQIPEGAAIMTLSHVHGSAVASELLLGGRTLTASEALRAGLVTRVLWPERFPLELLPLVKAMSEQSSQSMEATKALLRQSLRNKLNDALESETHILVNQWCSDECQVAIKKYTAKQIE